MNFLKKLKNEYLIILLIFLTSCVFTASLFINRGLPATFDGLTHVTTLAQFSTALKSGDFPVYWLNEFANYGLPIGIVAHQLPNYLGAFLNILFNNPVLSFNILVFLGILLSSLFFYYFLRLYFNMLPAFLGTFLFIFEPYKILNVYIRGAGPEIFSNLFLPLILISIYKFVVNKKTIWLFGFTIFVSCLVLTHPMNFLIYSIFFVPYSLFLVWEERTKIKQKFITIFSLLVGGILALGISAYYLLPLTVEIKYFYTGFNKNQLVQGQYLSFINFFKERWAYETAIDHTTRGNFIQTGIIETAVFVIGLAILILLLKKRNKFEFVHLSVVIGLIYIFFTVSISSTIYNNLPILGGIQYPWRMLNGFIFIPPIILAYFFSKKSSYILAACLITIVLFLRIPQLYGKNYRAFPSSVYYFTQKNLHSEQLNTIWSDKSQNYPVKKSQYTIIGGQGQVKSILSNSWRIYEINAKTKMQMLDYTFYFPGWKVYVDGKETQIQFQDINYRGLIEYYVPVGRHSILLKFEDTKVRFIGKLISLLSLFMFLGLFVFRKRLKPVEDKL